jgi:hypothetical protein
MPTAWCPQRDRAQHATFLQLTDWFERQFGHLHSNSIETINHLYALVTRE